MVVRAGAGARAEAPAEVHQDFAVALRQAAQIVQRSVDVVRLPAQQRPAGPVYPVAAAFEQVDRQPGHHARRPARRLRVVGFEPDLRHFDPQFRHAHVLVKRELPLARVRGVVHFHHDVREADLLHRDVAVAVVHHRRVEVRQLVRVQHPHAVAFVVQQRQAAVAVAGDLDAAHGADEDHHLLEREDGPVVQRGGAVAHFPGSAGVAVPQFEAALGGAHRAVLVVVRWHRVAGDELQFGDHRRGGFGALGRQRAAVRQGVVARLRRGVAVGAAVARCGFRFPCFHLSALDQTGGIVAGSPIAVKTFSFRTKVYERSGY